MNTTPTLSRAPRRRAASVAVAAAIVAVLIAAAVLVVDLRSGGSAPSVAASGPTTPSTLPVTSTTLAPTSTPAATSAHCHAAEAQVTAYARTHPYVATSPTDGDLINTVFVACSATAFTHYQETVLNRWQHATPPVTPTTTPSTRPTTPPVTPTTTPSRPPATTTTAPGGYVTPPTVPCNPNKQGCLLGGQGNGGGGFN